MGRSAPPLPRSCQRPAGLAVRSEAGADRRRTREGVRCPPARAASQVGAGMELTRQRLLRPRQQHSRRPPAPSSAAALVSAAATNRPSGAANRHNRRRPVAALPGGRAQPPLRLLSSARGPVRAPRNREQRRPELDRAGSPPPRGLLLSTRPFRRRARRETSSQGEGRSGRRSPASAQIRKSLGCPDWSVSVGTRRSELACLPVLP